ncbi:DNA-binding pseudobarrel domain superfamily [Arabidopsis thaliana x Arabidopsis arenosa]|uniref:DNA-binding pseudobarrel domain superfamily n=1 Tax=Arabidopsis thaliana x Arabidopsis arenosa TaxID=1240361 RepID=A0A8T2A218_9BRAS|nr:DNA-binding pseudobarrel domain superfamily [Arabidopsis thaliana x Arabidopsis arenosa]
MSQIIMTTTSHLPQDFTSSNGLNRKCSKSPRQIISSYSSSEKPFVTFTLAPVDGRHCRLRLPMQFTRENGINKPGKIYLLGKDGSKWLANLLSENNRGRMTLGDGWKSFVKANGLKTGDTYTFKLYWEDTIPVLSLYPEEYNTDTRVGQECSKESLPAEPSSQEKIIKDDNNKHESNNDESSSRKREDNHLRCIDSTSPSENRSLTLTITPDSLEHGRLRLPLQFMTENSMNKPGEITLLGKDGAKWMASLLLERRGRMSLGKGWKDFAKANGVKTGDSITLESIWEDTTPVLKLLSIESSSGQVSKESLSVEPSSGNMTEKAEKNREARRKYPPRSRESSSAIENQFMALTPPRDIISQVAHELRIGEVIIFRHEGDNMLQVSDLGSNCCGIRDVPAPSSNNDHDSIGTISMEMSHLRKEAGFSSYDGYAQENFEHPSKKKVKKNNPETEADYLSDHSCFVAHVTTSSLHTNALSLAVKESLPIEPSIKRNISEDDNNKEENNKEENSSFEREKNHRICIDSISSSHNRFLTLTITPDSLKHGRLRLPLQFMAENSMNKPGEITVLGKDGTKWLVSLLLERRGRMSLGKGWKDFAKKHGLKTGDSITLESIWEDASPVLKLLHIESSSVRGQSEFSKESHFIDASSGHKTREAEKNRDSSSDIENRFLTFTLAPEDVKDGNLRLPNQFMRINGINKPGKITLLGRGGLKWFAYLLSRDGTVVLGNGWKGFCEANGVMLGETFMLEFISKEDTNHVFKFYSSYGDQIHKC